MAIVTIKELVEAGVHFGTKSSLWHPRMAPFIYGTRNKVHILDLRETTKALIQAYYFMVKLAKANKTVLFVGTKRQAKDLIRDSARSVGMPYVAERWLGGTLTNNETIRSSIRRLDEIEELMSRPDYHRQVKKAQARHGRERRRILRNLEGVRTMNRLPDAMFVIDPKKEVTAVHEAVRVGIPVIGLVDTDCDPEQVNLPIPGNDDGIRSIQAVVKVLLDGIRQGRSEQTTAKDEATEAAEAKASGADQVAAKQQAEAPAAESAAKTTEADTKA